MIRHLWGPENRGNWQWTTQRLISEIIVMIQGTRTQASATLEWRQGARGTARRARASAPHRQSGWLASYSRALNLSRSSRGNPKKVQKCRCTVNNTFFATHSFYTSNSNEDREFTSTHVTWNLKKIFKQFYSLSNESLSAFVFTHEIRNRRIWNRYYKKNKFLRTWMLGPCRPLPPPLGCPQLLVEAGQGLVTGQVGIWEGCQTGQGSVDAFKRSHALRVAASSRVHWFLQQHRADSPHIPCGDPQKGIWRNPPGLQTKISNTDTNSWCFWIRFVFKEKVSISPWQCDMSNACGSSIGSQKPQPMTPMTQITLITVPAKAKQRKKLHDKANINQRLRRFPQRIFS